MSQLKELFELALGEGYGPDGTDPVDPGPDLARGRQALRRRRLGHAGVGLAAVAVVAGAALVPAALGGDQTQGSEVAAPPQRSTTPLDGTQDDPETTLDVAPFELPAVQLVAYSGEQPAGYRVAEVPDGWEIQGVNPYRLTIAAAGDPDQEPDSFIGKLVVMLDPAGTPLSDDIAGAEQVEVSGQPGVVHTEGGDAGETPPVAGGDTLGGDTGTGPCYLTGAVDRPTDVERYATSDHLDAAAMAELEEEGVIVTEVPCSEVPAPSDADIAPEVDLPPTQILAYLLADGRRVTVQAPASLGWDTAELVRFAGGVEVLPAAEASNG